MTINSFGKVVIILREKILLWNMTKTMMMILRNVSYCGGPGNRVLATMVTVYWPLTISNTFSKRPHKPCNTSKHVENGTTLEHFEGVLCNKYLSILQKFINNIFHPFDIIEFPLSLSVASNQNSLKSQILM